MDGVRIKSTKYLQGLPEKKVIEIIKEILEGCLDDGTEFSYMVDLNQTRVKEDEVLYCYIKPSTYCIAPSLYPSFSNYMVIRQIIKKYIKCNKDKTTKDMDSLADLFLSKSTEYSKKIDHYVRMQNRTDSSSEDEIEDIESGPTPQSIVDTVTNILNKHN